MIAGLPLKACSIDDVVATSIRARRRWLCFAELKRAAGLGRRAPVAAGENQAKT